MIKPLKWHPKGAVELAIGKRPLRYSRLDTLARGELTSAEGSITQP